MVTSHLTVTNDPFSHHSKFGKVFVIKQSVASFDFFVLTKIHRCSDNQVPVASNEPPVITVLNQCVLCTQQRSFRFRNFENLLLNWI